MEEQRTEGALQQCASETARVSGDYDGGRLITSAALIGIGILIEPELLAGLAIGAGIVVGLGWIGTIAGGAARLVARTAVRTGYVAVAQTRKIVVEATEGVRDIVTEARAVQETKQPLQ